MKHAVMLVGSADQSIIVTLIVPSFSPFENAEYVHFTVLTFTFFILIMKLLRVDVSRQEHKRT